ncbi:MAG: hypothetical protein LC798_10825 [Chloroflexi bacterium]|nr:hypothetical protein [Chloroflexota bacterium]
MTTAIYVDARGIIRGWLNTQAALVGAGKPLPLGAHLRLLRSPFKGAYALLTIVDGSDELIAEGAHRARVSASIFGLSEDGADRAAIAYANTIRALQRGNTPMAGAVCITVGGITGPTDTRPPADAAAQRLVDADFYLRPTP